MQSNSNFSSPKKNVTQLKMKEVVANDWQKIKKIFTQDKIAPLLLILPLAVLMLSVIMLSMMATSEVVLVEKSAQTLVDQTELRPDQEIAFQALVNQVEQEADDWPKELISFPGNYIPGQKESDFRKSRYESNSLVVFNNTDRDQYIWVQANLCTCKDEGVNLCPHNEFIMPHDGGNKPKNATQCNKIVGQKEYHILEDGDVKKFEIDIPICQVSQLDVNTVNKIEHKNEMKNLFPEIDIDWDTYDFDNNLKGCYTPFGKLWDGGLAFALDAEPDDYPTCEPYCSDLIIEQVCTPGEWDSRNCRLCLADGTWSENCWSFGDANTEGWTEEAWCGCCEKCRGLDDETCQGCSASACHPGQWDILNCRYCLANGTWSNRQELCPNKVIDKGKTVSLEMHAYKYGIAQIFKVDQLGDRPTASSKPLLVIPGRSAVYGVDYRLINTNFTPDEPGVYVIEANTYDSESCDKLCSATGQMYKNQNPGQCLGGEWNPMNQSCQSNCLQYLVVEERQDLPGKTCEVLASEKIINEGQSIQLTAAGEGNNPDKETVRLWVRRVDNNKITSLLQEERVYDDVVYYHLGNCESVNGQKCNVEAELNDLPVGKYALHCDVPSEPPVKKCSGNPHCEYNFSAWIGEWAIKPALPLPCNGWISCSNNDSDRFEVVAIPTITPSATPTPTATPTPLPGKKSCQVQVDQPEIFAGDSITLSAFGLGNYSGTERVRLWLELLDQSSRKINPLPQDLQNVREYHDEQNDIYYYVLGECQSTNKGVCNIEATIADLPVGRYAIHCDVPDEPDMTAMGKCSGNPFCGYKHQENQGEQPRITCEDWRGCHEFDNARFRVNPIITITPTPTPTPTATPTPTPTPGLKVQGRIFYDVDNYITSHARGGAGALIPPLPYNTAFKLRIDVYTGDNAFGKEQWNEDIANNPNLGDVCSARWQFERYEPKYQASCGTALGNGLDVVHCSHYGGFSFEIPENAAIIDCNEDWIWDGSPRDGKRHHCRTDKYYLIKLKAEGGAQVTEAYWKANGVNTDNWVNIASNYGPWVLDGYPHNSPRTAIGASSASGRVEGYKFTNGTESYSCSLVSKNQSEQLSVAQYFVDDRDQEAICSRCYDGSVDNNIETYGTGDNEYSKAKICGGANLGKTVHNCSNFQGGTVAYIAIPVDMNRYSENVETMINEQPVRNLWIGVNPDGVSTTRIKAQSGNILPKTEEADDTEQVEPTRSWWRSLLGIVGEPESEEEKSQLEGVAEEEPETIVGEPESEKEKSQLEGVAEEEPETEEFVIPDKEPDQNWWQRFLNIFGRPEAVETDEALSQYTEEKTGEKTFAQRVTDFFRNLLGGF